MNGLVRDASAVLVAAVASAATVPLTAAAASSAAEAQVWAAVVDGPRDDSQARVVDDPGPVDVGAALTSPESLGSIAAAMGRSTADTSASLSVTGSTAVIVRVVDPSAARAARGLDAALGVVRRAAERRASAERRVARVVVVDPPRSVSTGPRFSATTVAAAALTGAVLALAVLSALTVGRRTVRGRA